MQKRYANNMKPKDPKLQKILDLIAKDQKNLRRLKVKHIYVFGSFSRNESTLKSDVDLLVEFSKPVGFFHFYDVKKHLEGLLKKQVDLVVKDAIRPEFKKQIMKEMIRAA